ncbi:MAG: hypothetical protein J5494_05685, partial [Candidatus Methanomethylophilaceae archaeon]|nr:hypothetical protein [Candidatus Methanomethylophilaceae archaeon]
MYGRELRKSRFGMLVIPAVFLLSVILLASPAADGQGSGSGYSITIDTDAGTVYCGSAPVTFIPSAESAELVLVPHTGYEPLDWK